MKCNDITILCKVVDNYGDIGFVYRLARALTELDGSIRLRLVVSDLTAFKRLAPQIDATAAVQRYHDDGSKNARELVSADGSIKAGAAVNGENARSTVICDSFTRSGYDENARATASTDDAASPDDDEKAHTAAIRAAPHPDWLIYDWNADEVCSRAFREQPPTVILECFQCGRPDWLEALLFADGGAGASSLASPIAHAAHVVRILNIDYLTAEDYAEDFHCLKSGTRSIYVKKVNFMPGFTAKTGGLTLDRAFMQSRAELKPRLAGVADYAKVCSACADEHCLTVSIFSYERDFTPVVQALAAFQAQKRKTDAAFSVCALVAAGKSSAPFLQAWERCGKPFAAVPLPFLPQAAWDSLLCATDCNFVRGEDSLSRACLAGVPFVWQAYPQAEDYHLVKLAALNARLAPHLAPATFCAYDSYTRAYNVGTDSADGLLALLQSLTEAAAGFAAFADALVANGNFAEHLLSYLATLA